MLELRAERLGFGYPDRPPVLTDVNLTLRAGELAVLMGRNGGGKTTLLRLLAGLLTPQAGRVVIEGNGERDLRDSVGIVFQNPEHQMIAPTVEEEIALGLELRDVDPTRMRPVVDRLIERFDLEPQRYSAPEALSGGQKQRVALAAIMAWQPPFLLCDEPDSFLDAPSRRELMRGIDEVRGDCGILWIAPHARRLPTADRYYLLETGTVHHSSLPELMAVSGQATVP